MKNHIKENLINEKRDAPKLKKKHVIVNAPAHTNKIDAIRIFCIGTNHMKVLSSMKKSAIRISKKMTKLILFPQILSVTSLTVIAAWSKVNSI
jgi:hypothetical protein